VKKINVKNCYFCGDFINPNAGKYALMERFSGDNSWYEGNDMRVPGFQVVKQSNKPIKKQCDDQILLKFDGYWG